ncbi:hypothetical protein H072_10434 [Dactylellina haptotyla CBS 200.50]|uniref:alpha-glucosidase n=1 Tax=Dactylellina haptotyla (strain CBS 200.50) TaxID=1284197 RepID=S7ZZB7_DACHA|nr:hypothetical protein H072_10434 [Dactylellina haptotyla CBS 200.50]
METVAAALQGVGEKLETVVSAMQMTELEPPQPSVLQNDDTPHGDYEYAAPPAWKTPTKFIAQLRGKTGHTTRYGPSVDRLQVEIDAFTPTIARISITDLDKQRWEIPQEMVPLGQDLRPENMYTGEANYDLAFDEKGKDVGFAIFRKSDGEAVFDSRGLPISFCEHYMEISTKLPEDTLVYGLGEVTGPFLREPGSRFAFWARDAQTPLHENAYSSFPIFAGMHNGKAFGVYLHNSNALDMVYNPGMITYKIVGGIIDLFVFLGDTYEDVIKQYQSVTGFPTLPPFWSFGYHQCRWFYDTVEKLAESRQRNMEVDIPVDVFWLDIDYMIKYKLFTLDQDRYPKFVEHVEQMHKDNHKLVAILDPGVKCNIPNYKPWSRGAELDIFIKNGNTKKYFVGKVWPGHVVFPDWIHPRIQEYWTEMLRDWLKIMPVDGIWHDMNECSNFVNGDVWEVGGDAEEDAILIPTDEETVAEMAKAAAEGIEVEDDGKRGAAKPKPLAAFDPSKPSSITNPPYSVNHGNEDWPLSARSISVESYHHGGITEFDIHNLFGHLNCKVTYDSMINIRSDERPFILTRSVFAGSGKFASKWLGDNFSNWESMKYSISGMLNMQLFGIPHIGADIGGFNGAPSTELLLRWFQLGSMYPFCRNHNMPNTPSQEAHITEEVADVARTYLTLRYRLLPLWYTAFADVKRNGGSVVQPVWAVNVPQKVEDMAQVMKENNDAFMIDKKILVIPVVTKGQTSVHTWIPAGVWYEVGNGKAIASTEDQWVDLDAPIEKMPMYYKGGSIIPLHYNKTGKTTVDFRSGGFSLVIALDSSGSAEGAIYLDDGATFSSGKSYIQIYAELGKDTTDLVLRTVGEFGYNPINKNEYKISEVVILAVGSEPNIIPVEINLALPTKVSIQV